MRLRTFFVGTGDCLLLSSVEGKHVLIDGGPGSGAFRDNVLDTLKGIRNQRQGELLDLVIITHIDDDHIDGILQMLGWYEKQDRTGKPDGLPRIAAIWHNSWAQYRRAPRRRRRRRPALPASSKVGKLTPAIVTSTTERLADWYGSAMHIYYSTFESRDVILHVARGRKPISLNIGFRGGFVELTDPVHRRQVSPTLALDVLGPRPEAVDELRAVFVADGLANRPARPSALTPLSALNVLSFDRAAINVVADSVMTKVGQAAGNRDPRDLTDGIGDDAEVTVENRASIVVLATEVCPDVSEATCLLTGDATAQDVLHGLEMAGRLGGARSKFHCDIVKVQHHAAEFNFTNEFAERVVARHYVISANGQYLNPDEKVVRVLIERRAETKTPFTLWFTCSEKAAPPCSKPAMRSALQQAVSSANLVNDATPGQVTVRVLNDGAHFFDICTCPAAEAKCACVPADATTTVLVPQPT